jgi:hypothetical protein
MPVGSSFVISLKLIEGGTQSVVQLWRDDGVGLNNRRTRIQRWYNASFLQVLGLATQLLNALSLSSATQTVRESRK